MARKSRVEYQFYRRKRGKDPLQALARYPDKAKLVIKDVEDVTRKRTSRTRLRQFAIDSHETPDLVPAALAHRSFGRIQSLIIDDIFNVLDETLVSAIRDGRLDHLRHLCLSHVSEFEVFAAIADGLDNLEYLELSSCELDDEQLAALLQRSGLQQVKRLDLSLMYEIGVETMTALAHGALPELIHLDLSYVSVGDAAIAVLDDSPLMSTLTRFSYGNSKCGESLGLDVPLTEHSRPTLERWGSLENLEEVSLFLRLEKVKRKPASKLGPLLKKEPSLEVFRTICAAVEAKPAMLDEAIAGVAKWGNVRVAPSYTINKLVDGRLPAAMLGLFHGLKLFEIILDEDSNLAVDSDEADERIAALTDWLAGLEDEATKVRELDLSPVAWLDEFDVTYGELADTYFPMTEAAWSALFRAFRGVRVLNLSCSQMDVEITDHDAYELYVGFPHGFEYELDVGALLTASPLPELRALYLQGYSGDLSRWPDLPKLEVLDLSGRFNRRRAHSLGPRTPKLKKLILGGDWVTDFALSGGFADLGEEDRMWVYHDYCMSEEEEFEELLLTPDDVAEIRAAWPTLRKLLVGGEMKWKRLKKVKGQKPTIKDSRGESERHTLPW